jgi:hypothetical protein
LFRRHVRRRPQNDTGRRRRQVDRRVTLMVERRGGERLRDAEVRHDGVPVGQQHVLGLEVAVHDPPGMRVLECVGDLANEAHHDRYRERTLAGEADTQRLALDERHRVVRQPGNLASRVQCDDVWVLQPRGQRDLAFESRDGNASEEDPQL